MTRTLRSAETYRKTALVGFAACALPLLAVFAAENRLGLVPCAFCLVERKPYYVGLALALLALCLPPKPARIALWALMGVFLAALVLHLVHSGVEWHFWPDPIPECSAKDFHGMTLSERLAALPARPAKPCDFPDYPIPAIKLSFSNYGAVYALVMSAILAISLTNRKRDYR